MVLLDAYVLSGRQDRLEREMRSENNLSDYEHGILDLDLETKRREEQISELTSITQDDASNAECDRLAASPYDPKK